MFKKIFAALLFLSLTNCVFAADSVFSSQSENIQLKPVSSSYSSSSTKTVKPAVQTTNLVQESNRGYSNAINNLDSVQVQLREQMANYSTLMQQSKSNYQSKRNEYREYKKQYNDLKRKMKRNERSKKIIKTNMYNPGTDY